MKNPPRPSAAPPPAHPLSDGTRVMLDELTRWQALHAPLTTLDNETFASKYPAEYCEQLATATRARGTLRDAREWLRVLHPAPGAKGVVPTGVPEVTLALFVEHTRQLAVAVEAMSQGDTSPRGVEVEATRATANETYHSTRDRVSEAIGRNPTWTQHLDGHLASNRHAELDADAARLLRLGEALDAWFVGKDVVVKHALSIEGVTAETAKSCAQAATALESARVAAAGARESGRDTPAVNRVEGHVLVLMQSVFRAVKQAREQKKTQLVLRPGAATRRVITPNARVGRPKATAGDAPADGAVTNAAEATKPRTTRRRVR